MRHLTLGSAFGAIFILACMNPWTSFRLNAMDSQPWALIFGIVFLLAVPKWNLPPSWGAITILMSSGLVISIALSIDPPLADVARAIASYMTVVVVYLAAYTYFRRYGIPYKILYFSGYSWIALAAIEYFHPQVKNLIGSHRTSQGRGLTSFAPEPTFFAIFMIFLAWIILVANGYKPDRRCKIFVALSIFSVAFLARSATGIIYIGVFLAVYSLYTTLRILITGRIKRQTASIIAVLAIATPIAIWAFFTYASSTRAAMLLDQIVTNGFTAVFEADASGSRRLGDILLSIHAALYNWMIPGGLDTFETTKELVRGFWGDLIWYPSTGNKIMSWNGVLIYELGIFGLVSYIFLIRAATHRGSANWAEMTILVILAAGAIPMAFPLIPMLFALWAYQGRQKRQLSHSAVT